MNMLERIHEQVLEILRQEPHKPQRKFFGLRPTESSSDLEMGNGGIVEDLDPPFDLSLQHRETEGPHSWWSQSRVNLARVD